LLGYDLHKVLGLTIAEAAAHSGGSVTYIAALCRLLPAQVEQVRNGTLPLSDVVNPAQVSDRAIEAFIRKAGLARVSEMLGRLKPPVIIDLNPTQWWTNGNGAEALPSSD
jgi:hypothetical protein